MVSYLLRRLFLYLSIILTVHLCTFFLFFTLYTPQDLARFNLGEKASKPEVVESWVKLHHLDKPILFNANQTGTLRFTDTLLASHGLSLFYFDFGKDLDGQLISKQIKERITPSLLITVPQFCATLLISLWVSFLTMRYPYSRSYKALYFFITVGLSVSPLFFLLFVQKVFAIELKLMPISGFNSSNPLPFIILPNIAGILAGISGQSRWFIGLMRQELHTKNLQIRGIEGMPLELLIDKHLFKQSLIPIVTSITVAIPLLITGSVLLETFFSIPGLGSLGLQALTQKDIFMIRAVTALGVILYCIGIFLTDLLYLVVDPRIKLD